jgi:3-dehydroquinate synthase
MRGDSTFSQVLSIQNAALLGTDPFALDFGHWAAHKLEQLSDYQIRHGEAVAIGIALDVMYSRNIGLLDAASATRILGLLRKLGFDLFANELMHLDVEHQPMVLKGLEEFREHLGGQLTLTMLRGIGAGVEVHEIILPKMLNALAELPMHQSRSTFFPLSKAAL